MMKVVCFDLDDTLYKEIDFLKSAYREVASYAYAKALLPCESCGVLYKEMLVEYMKGNNAFEYLNACVGLDIPMNDYLNIYRNHKPEIYLEQSIYTTLIAIRDAGNIIGLITDGRSVQQRNKIRALGLHEFIEEDMIVISEEFGTSKPSEENYKYFMERFNPETEFIYVGDNPEKDFIAPNKLGWKTICLKDDGSNIHKQDFQVSSENLPDIVVPIFKEIDRFI